MIPSIRTQNMR